MPPDQSLLLVLILLVFCTSILMAQQQVRLPPAPQGVREQSPQPHLQLRDQDFQAEQSFANQGDPYCSLQKAQQQLFRDQGQLSRAQRQVFLFLQTLLQDQESSWRLLRDSLALSSLGQGFRDLRLPLTDQPLQNSFKDDATNIDEQSLSQYLLYEAIRFPVICDVAALCVLLNLLVGYAYLGESEAKPTQQAREDKQRQQSECETFRRQNDTVDKFACYSFDPRVISITANTGLNSSTRSKDIDFLQKPSTCGFSDTQTFSDYTHRSLQNELRQLVPVPA